MKYENIKKKITRLNRLLKYHIMLLGVTICDKSVYLAFSEIGLYFERKYDLACLALNDLDNNC